MKQFLLILFSFIIFCSGNGQSITIDNANIPTGPYGQGSSIAVLFNPKGVFPINNNFELYLSDVNGDFTGGEVKIGEYQSHYSTFINGIIPTGTPPSLKYKLQIRAKNGTVTSTSSNLFEIRNNPGTNGNFINAVGSGSAISKLWLWVKCTGNATAITIENLLPKTITGILKNEFDTTIAFAGDIPRNYSINGNSEVEISSLKSVHYRLLNKVVEATTNIISTQAWYLVNNKTVGPFSAVLSTVCFSPSQPGDFKFKVDLDRIIGSTQSAYYNFPGYLYEANWDDNTPLSQFSIQQIDANGGLLTHGYKMSSCSRTVTTNGTTYYNSIGPNLKVILINPPCTQSVNTISPVQVFEKPEIKFSGPSKECEGKVVTFVNISTLGLQGNSDVSGCVSPNITFRWYVDNDLVKTSSFIDSYSTSSLLPGKHTITLKPIYDDNEVPCPPSPYSQEICIERKTTPIFSVIGTDNIERDSIAECASSSSLTIKTANKTANATCGINEWKWIVYNDIANEVLVPGTDYTITPNDTAKQPTFKFSIAGRYRIELSAINSCGSFITSHIVKVLNAGGGGGVTLPKDTGYCSSSETIDFGKNVAHRPSYSSNEGDEKYAWSVSGNPNYSFENPTNSTSQFPIIKFSVYGTYVVKVNFTNKCGSQSDTQRIIFSSPITIDAGVPDVELCYKENTIVLTGAINPASAVKWTTSGSGLFVPDDNLKSMYTLSSGDKLAGNITLTLSANSGNSCAGSSDEIKVKVYSENAGTNKIDTTCSGGKLSYNPTSAVAASTFTWTSVVSKGTITGNSATGTGVIADVLVNTNATADGEVVYTIIPRANNCDGLPFTYAVVVRPKPTLNAKADTNSICSNGSVSIRLASNLSGANYSWSSTVISGAASGNTILPNQSVAAINDVLSNTSNANAIVRYKIIAISGCASDTSTVDITVLPGSTKADAGQNQYLCNKNSTTLIGNNPAVGTGQWIQTSGPSAKIETPANATTVVSGLSANNIYNFGWVITGSSNACGSDTSDVVITVRPPLTIPNAGDTINLCTTNGNVVTLNANAVQSSETGKWTIGSSTIGSVVITNPNSAVTTATGLTVGTKYLLWTITNDANCPPLSDIVVINVGAGADAAKAGNDQELCNATQANLAGNTPSAGAGKWRQISGPSNSIISSDISPKAVVSGLVNGTYEFEWSLAAGGTSSCGNSIDTVRIIIYPAIQASVSPLTQTICNGGTITINSNTPTGGNGTYKYQWQSSINNGVFTDMFGEINTTLIASPTVDIRYRLVVTSGPCSTPTDTASVIVQPGISNNTITASQAICVGNTPALIVGSMPAGGDGIFSYQWQSSADSIIWNDLGVNSKDYQPALITSSLVYRRIVKTALCDAVSNTVTVTVNPDAKALFQPLKSVDCAPFNITPTVINQAAYADRNGSFNWFANNTVIGSGVFPNYTIANAGDSVLIKLIAVSKFGCKNDSMQAWFFSPINPKPAFILSDTVGCGPIAITLTNTTTDANNFNFIWDFGNGETSNQQQPSAVNFLANPNFGDTIYTVRLKATGGCDTIAVAQSIRVKSLPKSLFTPDIVEGCSPMKVTFTNTSRGSNASFVWDFGDGSAQVPATNPSIQHIFKTGVKDTFYVKLYGSNDCGKDTQQYAIVVNPNRIRLDFAVNGNQKNLCIPDTILFVNNTTGANKFEWDFGDGSPKLTTTKGIDSVYHEYTQRGVYTVTLFGTNGCSDTTSTETITVENRPNVSFTATPSEVCLGGTIQMNNTSDISLAWAWDFGDGSTSSQLNPAKTYINTGNYQISLMGTKIYPQGFGCPATATANVVVNGPAGELRYKAGFACLGDAIQLETISNNTSQYRYYLGNGDSIISNTPVVNYTYKLPGTYLPSVLLVAGNCSKLVKGVDSIKIDRIQAGFRFSPVYSCGATRINSTDTSDAYFGIVKREWDFGDGTTASIANPFKTYTSAGAYNVRLRITGASGCTNAFDTLVNVQVRDIPVAAISSDNVACTSNRILFIAATQSVDAIVGHNWSFGNNTTGTGDIAATTYNSTGTFTVRLISRTSFGCADTVTKIITVRQSPTVTASADVRICLGQSTQLNVSGAANYQWSPAEGLSCTTCANPIASPTITTQYMATGTNAIGCPNTDSITVEVVQPFTMTVTANDTLCIGQSSQLFASGANRYVWNPGVGLSASNIPNPIAAPNSTTSYRVVGFDSYNCFTDTAYTVVAVGGYPTVELGRGDTVVAGTAITFKPILTNGPFKNFFWTPTTGLSPNNVENPVATINNSITYTLVAENIYGCTGTDTISYQVFCSKDDQVYIPNAFSPDGDGVNDVFMVYGKGIKVDYFRVYNRWGQVVFDGGSNYLPNLPQYGWNGRVGGKPATQDVYVYMVQLKCTAGGTFTYEGNVSLLLMR